MTPLRAALGAELAGRVHEAASRRADAQQRLQDAAAAHRKARIGVGSDHAHRARAEAVDDLSAASSHAATVLAEVARAMGAGRAWQWERSREH